MSGAPEIEPEIAKALAGLPDDLAGFASIFQNEIRPALRAREGERIAAAEKAKKGQWYGVGAGLAIAMVAGLLTRSPFALFAAGAAGFGISAWFGQDIGRLQKEAKEMIVQPVASKLNLTFNSDPGEVSSLQRHREIGLLPGWDRQSTEDLVTGARNDVKFELFEAHLEDKHTSTDSNGRSQTRWVTVFRGQCLRCEFPKRFFGRTLVTRDAGFFNRFGGGGELKRAALEDPAFERIFEVYTTDQVESRFLLTPDVMQKLVDIEQAFHGGKLKCCFADGEMMITVEGGDLFEPGSMFVPLDNPERIRELLNDFAAIFRIIDSVVAGRRRQEASRGS